MEHIGSRIKAFREELGLTQTDLFRATGIKQTTLSSIETGTEPKAGVITALLATYSNLNPDWLLTGQGSMLRDGRELTPAPKPEPAAVATPVHATAQLLPVSTASAVDYARLLAEVTKRADRLEAENDRAWAEADRYRELYLKKISFLYADEEDHPEPSPEPQPEPVGKADADSLAAGINPSTGTPWIGVPRDAEGNVRLHTDRFALLESGELVALAVATATVEFPAIGVDYSDSDAA